MTDRTEQAFWIEPDHAPMLQAGSDVCVCGVVASDPIHTGWLNKRVQRRLAGHPHRHHADCIHNLSPDEQIALRGRDREWWLAMGLPIPEQITPDQWEADDGD